MKSVNYKSGDLSDFKITLLKTEGGYTIQNKDGAYLNFTNPSGNSCDINGFRYGTGA